MPFSVQKPVKNTKNELLSVGDSGAHFSVPNTEFEGGDDGRGYGDYIFLVKQAQPSHRSKNIMFGSLFVQRGVISSFFTSWLVQEFEI
jgi:hypothetical protein